MEQKSLLLHGTECHENKAAEATWSKEFMEDAMMVSHVIYIKRKTALHCSTAKISFEIFSSVQVASYKVVK